MANPAAAAQHQARGGDGAAGRPATERAQGTGSPRLQGAAPAPAPAQQPRVGWRGGNPLAAGAVGGSAAGRARRAQAGAGADARRHRARCGAPLWRLLRCRAAGLAVAAPRLVRGCAAAAGFAIMMARVCFESRNSRLA